MLNLRVLDIWCSSFWFGTPSRFLFCGKLNFQRIEAENIPLYCRKMVFWEIATGYDKQFHFILNHRLDNHYVITSTSFRNMTQFHGRYIQSKYLLTSRHIRKGDSNEIIHCNCISKTWHYWWPALQTWLMDFIIDLMHLTISSHKFRALFKHRHPFYLPNLCWISIASIENLHFFL